jgi:hypothetical protein
MDLLKECLGDSPAFRKELARQEKELASVEARLKALFKVTDKLSSRNAKLSASSTAFADEVCSHVANSVKKASVVLTRHAWPAGMEKLMIVSTDSADVGGRGRRSGGGQGVLQVRPSTQRRRGPSANADGADQQVLRRAPKDVY